MIARMKSAARLAAALGLAFPAACPAVSLAVDGVGQALIYPYYTVQSTRGAPFNTYLSVVNHSPDAKALRLRFREGRLAKEVLAANVFLGPNDAWAGAVVPSSGGARLVSVDRSCTEPAIVDPAGLAFTAAGYLGDGGGDGIERLREGFIEVLEMATLVGSSAVAATPNSSGIPPGCAAVAGNPFPAVAPPTGGLSGTLTLINVASGMDFTVNAEALADLSSRPFYRVAGDAYPDFNAAEVAAVSVVEANGSVYRSQWSRPADAVSAVLMRAEWWGEIVLDSGTQSLTDVVVTFPTRHHHAPATASRAPFSRPAEWSDSCVRDGTAAALGEALRLASVTREGRRSSLADACGTLCPPGLRPHALCAASTAVRPVNGAPHLGTFPPASVFGSAHALRVDVFPASLQNGWLSVAPRDALPLTSLPSSLRWPADGGIPVAGSHRFEGLPVVGFAARTFVNGTLACDAGTCQGNYGGAVPLKYRRAVTP